MNYTDRKGNRVPIGKSVTFIDNGEKPQRRETTEATGGGVPSIRFLQEYYTFPVQHNIAQLFLLLRRIPRYSHQTRRRGEHLSLNDVSD